MLITREGWGSRPSRPQPTSIQGHEPREKWCGKGKENEGKRGREKGKMERKRWRDGENDDNDDNEREGNDGNEGEEQ